MKKWIIGSAIVGGVGLFIYSIYNYVVKQADLLKQFEYKIIGIKFKEFTLQLIKGTLSIRFESLSDVEITVNEFYLDFYFNEENVGYLTDTRKFILPAKAFTTIDFDFTLNPQFIFKNAIDIIAYAAKQKDASIRVEGYVSLKSGFISTTVPVTYATTIKEILSN